MFWFQTYNKAFAIASITNFIYFNTHHESSEHIFTDTLHEHWFIHKDSCNKNKTSWTVEKLIFLNYKKYCHSSEDTELLSPTLSAVWVFIVYFKKNTAVSESIKTSEGCLRFVAGYST